MTANRRSNETSWTALLPVKAFTRAKSRFAGTADDRRDLARALLVDLLTACADSRLIEEVMVVSAELELPRFPDRRFGLIREATDHGMNSALKIAAARSRPENPVVAMACDLPCVTGASLDDLLSEALSLDRWFIADSAGTGTTILGSRHATALRPRFGSGSAASHRADGALQLRSPRLFRFRRDVDTRADLADALRMGTGPTVEALSRRTQGFSQTDRHRDLDREEPGASPEE